MAMKKFILFSFLAGYVVSLSGCGTIKGVGEDIGAVGHWLTHGSDNVKEGNNSGSTK